MYPTPLKDSGIDVTDIFCGCGGSTQGAVDLGLNVDMAINHWDLAVETHNTNHPETDHDCTDITRCDPRRYPTTRILWASPECVTHSLASGGNYDYEAELKRAQRDLFAEEPPLPDEAAERSRATMGDVIRFTRYHQYDIVVVENVVDIKRWPLYTDWLGEMHKEGYKHHEVYLNSMFCHPTPQSRDRIYVVFWKKGNEKPDLDFRFTAPCPKCDKDVEAVQSWRDTKLGRQRWGRYQQQYDYRCPHCAEVVTPYYYAAFNCIDWTIEAPKIGERDRPLAEKTMERIRYGLEEYGRDPLIIMTNAAEVERVRSAISDPCYTQTGTRSAAILSTDWSSLSGDNDAANKVALVAPFLSKQYTGYKRPLSLDEPIGTQTSTHSHAIVGLPMLASVNYFDDRCVPCCQAYPTQTTQTKWALVRPPAFIAELYGKSTAKSIDDRLGCVTAGGVNHAIIDTGAFLSYYYSSSQQVSRLDEPVRTVTTRDRAALVEAAQNVSVEDCTFRMLQPHEIQAAMAFPEKYVLLGNKREQVKMLGNAVTPPAARILLDACVATLA